jgi:hypothetical protein
MPGNNHACNPASDPTTVVAMGPALTDHIAVQ